MSQTDHERAIAFAKARAARTLPVLVCVLLALVAMYLPLPRRFVAVLPLVLAVVLSVRLLRFLSNRPGREKIWPAVTLGVVGLLLSSLAVQGVFYRTVHAYEECVAGAQTAQAAADCDSLRGGGLLGFAQP